MAIVKHLLHYVQDQNGQYTEGSISTMALHTFCEVLLKTLQMDI